MFYLGKKERFGYTGADSFLLPAQTFVSVLVVLAIINIVVTITLFITSCNKRRNYYITNYVAIGLNVVMSVFVGMFVFIYVAVLMDKFYNSVDWVGLESVINRLKNPDNPAVYYEVSKSPLMFIIGMLVGLIVLANAAAWILNLIWKLKLMKGEKELLENGFVKEVA